MRVRKPRPLKKPVLSLPKGRLEGFKKLQNDHPPTMMLRIASRRRQRPVWGVLQGKRFSY